MLSKTRSRSKVSKRPLVDKEHRRRVEALPCYVCRGGAGDSHHIRECFPRTMGRRIGDNFVIPLCRQDHDYVHAHSKTVWRSLARDPVYFAEYLYAETLALRKEAK